MLFNNSRVRRRLAVRNPVTMKIALPLDDHRKLEAFVALLAQIDKRNRANSKEIKSRDPTKAKDALLGQYRKGSLKYGPTFFKQILYSYSNSYFLFIQRTLHEYIYEYYSVNLLINKFLYGLIN
jgi:hypothetical protein